jgi:hypothetical protein
MTADASAPSLRMRRADRTARDDPVGKPFSRPAERRVQGRVGHRSAAQRLGTKAHQVQRIHEVHQRRTDAQPLLVRRDIGHVVAHAGDQPPSPGPLKARALARSTSSAVCPRCSAPTCEQLGQCNALAVTNHDKPERPQPAMVGRTQGQVRSAGPLLCAGPRRRRGTSDPPSSAARAGPAARPRRSPRAPCQVHRRLHPRAEVELAQDVLHVDLHRGFGNVSARANSLLLAPLAIRARISRSRGDRLWMGSASTAGGGRPRRPARSGRH